MGAEKIEEMSDTLLSVCTRILRDVLYSLYQPMGFSLIIAVLFMFVYQIYSGKHVVTRLGLKAAVEDLIDWFKSPSFRKQFYLTFYTAMLLFRTLLNRDIWVNPLINVVGVWGIFDTDGQLSVEVPLNLTLFIPFIVLLFWSHGDCIIGKEVHLTRVLTQSTKIVFFFSFSIEMLQLFLRLGTWQLSDIFFNTLGGLIGGILYYMGWKLLRRSEYGGRKTG